jgi:tetratricopeptide (TPR) repeat protein
VNKNRESFLFRDLWAQGYFDNITYWTLTAPINLWPAKEATSNCLSEYADTIADEGWGVVSWKGLFFVYSDEAKAKTRALELGDEVKPLKLKCLTCFASALSTFVPYLGLVLDEKWHLQPYICRNTYCNSDEADKVTHLYLEEAFERFSLEGCQNKGQLEWKYVRHPHDPHEEEQWCRPVPFPVGKRAFFDRTRQGEAIDVETITDPDSFGFILMPGLAALATPRKTDKECLFIRTNPDIAFRDTQGEKAVFLRGGGVWFPIARAQKIFGGYKTLPWLSGIKGISKKIKLSPEVSPCTLLDGKNPRVNQAFFVLERGDGEALPDWKSGDCQKFVDSAKQHLERAQKIAPWDFYVRSLLNDLETISPQQVPGLIYADKIIWYAKNHETDMARDCFEKSLEYIRDYHLALWNYFISCDKKIIATIQAKYPDYPSLHLYLAGVAMNEKNPEKELYHYFEVIKHAPYMSFPYYNAGNVFEDQGDYDSAGRLYALAIEKQPSHAEAWIQLGLMALRDGDQDAFIKNVCQGLASNPRRKHSYDLILSWARDNKNEELFQWAAKMMSHEMPLLYGEYFGEL